MRWRAGRTTAFSVARDRSGALVRAFVGDPLYVTGVGAIQAQRAARHTFRDLWDAEVGIYSQFGEDGILDYLCDAIGLARPRVLELGCGDYRECNSRFLAEYRCASVTMVDARADLVRSVRGLSAYYTTTLDPRQEWITPDSVTGLVESAREVHGGLDIVSLDIDGNDYWVAEQIDFTGVSIVVVEYQPLFGAHRRVTIPRNDHFDRSSAHYSWLYFGASLPAFIHLMDSRGFVFIGTNRPGNNAFFVAGAFADRVPLPKPDTADLAKYVIWTVREARDPEGTMTGESASAVLPILADLPLVDLETGLSTTVGAIG